MFSRNYILILTDSLNFYIYWTPDLNGGSYKFSSVRPSVRPPAMFSGLKTNVCNVFGTG